MTTVSKVNALHNFGFPDQSSMKVKQSLQYI